MARQYTLHRPARTESEIDFRAELNEQQFAAVTSPPGQQLVIAGAGSGKTRTLTYRVAYLLDNGIDASNILLLTFTNKASREMLDRVEELVPGDNSQIWGGTFHSIGNRILRKHAEKIGFTRSFSILDSEDQKELMTAAIGAAGVNTKEVRFPKPEVVASMFSLSVNMGQPLHEIVEERYSYFLHLEEELEKVQKGYVAKKEATNSMDFDDLLTQTVYLLEEEPEILELYQHQFQFILVDEYQDTNLLQGKLVDMLSGKHGNIMVVGDDAQSIYSWRGANFENILAFPKRYPEASVFKIEVNYRSVPEVLGLANTAIAANKKQFPKTLRPTRESRGSKPAFVTVSDPGNQAAFVAQRILELQDEEGIEFDEIAVLYRAHFHAMELQLEMTSRGIPFQITSGLRFFEQAHIKDVAAFMRFAVNRQDEISFKRMARLLVGVGNVSADKAWQAWCRSEGARGEKLPETFSEYLLPIKMPEKAKSGWEQLAYTLDELVADGLQAPSAMMVSVIEGVYDEYMREKFPNYESRKQDLEQLMGYGESFDDTLEFLGQLALLSGVDKQKQEPETAEVVLSSVHQAKGLEWKAVFVIWLADGMFPGRRVLEADDEASLEEERRLFYVAVTRAKDELYLVYPMMWPTSYSGDVMQRPSRFLGDFPEGMVEEWNVGTGF